MSTTSTLSLLVRARTALDAPYSGNGVSQLAYDAEWTSGTGDNQADLAAQQVATVAGSGNITFDLRAMTDANGDAVNGAELAALLIEVPTTSSGTVSVERAVSNGAPILSGSTDSVDLPAGGMLLLIYPEDGGPALSASAKDLRLVNAGGSDVDVTITSLQRSA